MRRIVVWLAVLNVLATLAAVGWTVLWLDTAWAAFIHSNRDAVQTLTDRQHQHIAVTFAGHLRAIAVPLLFTNCLWLALSAFAWRLLSAKTRRRD